MGVALCQIDSNLVLGKATHTGETFGAGGSDSSTGDDRRRGSPVSGLLVDRRDVGYGRPTRDWCERRRIGWRTARVDGMCHGCNVDVILRSYVFHCRSRRTKTMSTGDEGVTARQGRARVEVEVPIERTSRKRVGGRDLSWRRPPQADVAAAHDCVAVASCPPASSRKGTKPLGGNRCAECGAVLNDDDCNVSLAIVM